MLIFLEILCATNSFLKEIQLIGHKLSVHIELFGTLYVLISFYCSLFHCSATSCYWGAFERFLNVAHNKIFIEYNQRFSTPMYIDWLTAKQWYYFVVFFQRVRNIWKSEEIYFCVFFGRSIQFCVILIFNRNCLNLDFFHFIMKEFIGPSAI